MAPLIAAAAPIIKALLANGLSTLAGAVMSKGQEWVEEKTGLDLSQAPKASPEQLLLMKQAEMKHEEVLIQAGIENRKLDFQEISAFLADTQSARSRDVELVKTQGRNVRGDNLAYGAVLSLLVCILLLFVADVPPQSRDLLLVVLGSLVTIVKDVYGFEFGSSKDSQRNAQAVADSLKNGR